MTTATVTKFPVPPRPTPTFNGLKLLSWGQLNVHQFPPREFVIEPILRDRQVGMVYAPTGVGKTWFTLALAAVAASGHGAGFLGFQREGDGLKTLVIDGEMDAQDLQDRLRLIVPSVGAIEATVGANLTILARQHQDHDTPFPDIGDEDWQTAILDHCERHGVKLLILDNFSTLAQSVGDENAAGKMNKVNSMLLRAKQAGVTCLLVHHANKTNGSYRGSSAITVTLDLNIALSRPEGYTMVDGETAFVINFEKVRGSIPRQITSSRVVVFKTSDGVGQWVEDEHPVTQGQVIRQFWESLKFTSQKELADHMRLSEPTISRRVKAAIAAGVFTETDLKGWQQKAKELRKVKEQPDDAPEVDAVGLVGDDQPPSQHELDATKF